MERGRKRELCKSGIVLTGGNPVSSILVCVEFSPVPSSRLAEMKDGSRREANKVVASAVLPNIFALRGCPWVAESASP